MTDTIATSPDLLNIAERVFGQYGFALERARTSGGVEVVLAENPLFVIALGAAATLDSLPLLETEAGALLSERVDASEVGAKRWDAYLVLLATQRPAQLDDTALFDIAYNTRMFRRVVRVGLSPTDEDVKTALSAFLPLAVHEHPEVAQDALVLLSAELPSHGVDRDVAERAIASFRSSGGITDA